MAYTTPSTALVPVRSAFHPVREARPGRLPWPDPWGLHPGAMSAVLRALALGTRRWL